MSSIQMFALLYGLSFIPWLLAFRLKAKDTQVGLWLIDAALSVASYVYLWDAIGAFSLLAIVALTGIGYVCKGLGLRGYDTLFDALDARKVARA